MRINPYLFGILVLVSFLGTTFLFQAAGIWSVSGKLTNKGEAVQPNAADVNSIKGWMTLDQISTTYNVLLADILTKFNLPADTPASTAVKDLESDTFSMTDLRSWLQSQMKPIPSESTPEPTIAPLQKATSTPEIIPTETPPTLRASFVRGVRRLDYGAG